MNLLHNLNPEQLAAVTLPSQSALILAGAGSGKTRVLTTRIAWLLQTQQVSPAGIMAVTFTNKAAKEMLTRLSTKPSTKSGSSAAKVANSSTMMTSRASGPRPVARAGQRSYAAARRGVYIVSPSTMWAVLGTMRALMQDVRMRAEAGQIKNQVAELMKDVGRLEDRVTKLRKHFIDMQNDVQQIEITTGKITRRGVAIDAVELTDLPALSGPGAALAPAAD